VILNPI